MPVSIVFGLYVINRIIRYPEALVRPELEADLGLLNLGKGIRCPRWDRHDINIHIRLEWILILEIQVQGLLLNDMSRFAGIIIGEYWMLSQ
jgi:hypothetical protein